MDETEFGEFFSHASDEVHVEPASSFVVYFYAFNGDVVVNSQCGVSFIREVTIPGFINPPDSIDFSSQYSNDDVHLMSRVDVTRLPGGSYQFVARRRGPDDRFHEVHRTSAALRGRLQVEFNAKFNHRTVPVDVAQLGVQVGTLRFKVEQRLRGEDRLNQGPFAPDKKTIAHVSTSGAHGNHREKWVVKVDNLADHLHDDLQFRERLAMVSPFVKATNFNLHLSNVLFTVGPQTYLLQQASTRNTALWRIFPYATRIV